MIQLDGVQAHTAPRVVVLSGLSGSGKSTAIRALEDVGFFCIDNLPVVLLDKLIELFPSSPEEIEQIALVVDARESRFLEQFKGTIERIRAAGSRLEVLFLDCADRVLIRRYSETRRRHPQAQNGSIQEGIELERQLLAEMRNAAARVIDTTDLTPHQLRQIVQEHFTRATLDEAMSLAVVSFGFKYGIPPQADLVFDVRFLPNPYFVPTLRDRSGLDAEVRSYVFQNPESALLLEHVKNYVTTFRPMYDREGKSYLTVGIGCTGGRHRSVAIVEALVSDLEQAGVSAVIKHRDVDLV